MPSKMTIGIVASMMLMIATFGATPSLGAPSRHDVADETAAAAAAAPPPPPPPPAEFEGDYDSSLSCLRAKDVSDAVDCALEKVNDKLDEMQAAGGRRGHEERASEIFGEMRSIVARGFDVVFGSDRGDAVHGTNSVEARFFDALEQELDDETEVEDENRNSEDDSAGESRKKKFGKKKKKKALQKIMMLAMVLKAKLSLLLQLFSTHLQVKFLGIAIVSLLLNLARFWIDLKKGGHPSKVIYYEHAQHQHHYDHEDEHGGYWGRSSDDAQDLAYSGYHHGDAEHHEGTS